MTKREAEPDQFWYNTRTGQVEFGPKSKALDRVGPFASAADAARAPELWKTRAEEWRQSEESED